MREDVHDWTAQVVFVFVVRDASCRLCICAVRMKLWQRATVEYTSLD